MTGNIKQPIAWFLPIPFNGAINPIADAVTKTITPIHPLRNKDMPIINKMIEITNIL